MYLNQQLDIKAPFRACPTLSYILVAPRNLAQRRRMALNTLNQEKSLKRSLRQKMKRAAMNNDYMMTVLQSCKSIGFEMLLPCSK